MSKKTTPKALGHSIAVKHMRAGTEECWKAILKDINDQKITDKQKMQVCYYANRAYKAAVNSGQYVPR